MSSEQPTAMSPEERARVMLTRRCECPNLTPVVDHRIRFRHECRECVIEDIRAAEQAALEAAANYIKSRGADDCVTCGWREQDEDLPSSGVRVDCRDIYGDMVRCDHDPKCPWVLARAAVLPLDSEEVSDAK